MNYPARGRLIAELLRGAWRERVVPCPIVADDGLLRTLAQSGVLGLVGERCTLEIAVTPEVARHTVWWQALRGTEQAQIVAELVVALRSRGVEPVLFKGVATSRYYARVGARPVGDVDLLVAEREFTKAEEILRELGYLTARKGGPSSGGPVVTAVGPSARIDLQTGMWPLGIQDVQRALSSATSILLANVPVRIPPVDVEVRFLAVHAAKHRFMRPLWSCDVAAAIEGSPQLDMDCISAGSRRSQSWLAASIGIAIRLLGLQFTGASYNRFSRMAAWIEPYVLARWGDDTAAVTRPSVVQTIAHEHDVKRACRLMARAWPDRVDAEIILGWPLSYCLGPPAVAALVARRGLLLAQDFYPHFGAERPIPPQLGECPPAPRSCEQRP